MLTRFSLLSFLAVLVAIALATPQPEITPPPTPLAELDNRDVVSFLTSLTGAGGSVATAFASSFPKATGNSAAASGLQTPLLFGLATVMLSTLLGAIVVA